MARAIVSLVILASTVWVAVDTSRLGVKRGCLGGGLADMGIVGWSVAMFFLWIVAFPLYLFSRPKYVRRARLAENDQPFAVAMPTPASPPPGWYPDPSMPGGRRWWDGHRWGPPASRPAAPPGWYPDPSAPGERRWWDGNRWAG